MKYYEGSFLNDKKGFVSNFQYLVKKYMKDNGI